MPERCFLLVLLALLGLLLPIGAAWAAPPIVITGATRADPATPAVAGARNIEVYYARESGWTYNHHVDMACWKGRLYVAWDSCRKDEDVGVSRERYATSADGVHWSEPQMLFPEGLSTALRMYFYVAPNGRMLALAGLRSSADTPGEVRKGGLIVREIRQDHSLGEVFLLRRPSGDPPAGLPPEYSASNDHPFVEACQHLLQNRPVLEQQDYGMLLGDRRMKWHDPAAWPADEPSRADFNGRFGKAMCFFHRADGALVDVMKWGWVLVSHDEGATWSAPVRPPTLVTGMAKVWGQRTPGGRYVLVYNPDPEKRYPLVMVHGDDGVTFGDMRIVNGELPPMRFAGRYKVLGPQYPRGISEWSSDGSRKDDAVWVAYSMNKEDIYVSRIPEPGR
jgi:hypothetical protein